MKLIINFIKSLCVIMFIMLMIPITALGSATDSEEVSEQKYFMGEVVNTGNDTGFSEQNAIVENDLHYGWKLGDFSISNFTRVIDNEQNEPIFLKNVGDKITLSFTLLQDISMLNNNQTLSIIDNTKAFDEYFGITETSFGYGALIMRHTDYQNFKDEPVLHTHYLTAVNVGTDTTIEFLEEGDYEVALNYKIKSDPTNILGLSIFPTLSDYRIFFKFSVRNGNTMVYPFDAITGEELVNTSLTENGFYLDFAKSRYLDIDVKKTIYQQGATGLTEDVRFNRPAKDGEIYTDEGIYTFSVSNRYTNQTTTKVIYVGTDDILRAHVTTGLPIPEIEEKIAEGATINSNGTITNAVAVVNTPSITESSETSNEELDIQKGGTDILTEDIDASDFGIMIMITAIILLLILVVMCAVLLKKKNKSTGNKEETEENL